MHDESGDLLEHLGLGEIHGHVEGLEQRCELVEPFLLQQHRSGLMPGRDRTLDHLGRLREIQSVGRLAHPPQHNVGERDVVAQTVVGGVRDGHDVHPRSASLVSTRKHIRKLRAFTFGEDEEVP